MSMGLPVLNISHKWQSSMRGGAGGSFYPAGFQGSSSSPRVCQSLGPLCLINIPLCGMKLISHRVEYWYSTLSIHHVSQTDNRVISIWAIINNATLDLYIHVSVWMYVFRSPGHILRMELLGHTGFLCLTLGETFRLFSKVPSILHPHQQCMRISMFLCPWQYLIFTIANG